MNVEPEERRRDYLHGDVHRVNPWVFSSKDHVEMGLHDNESSQVLGNWMKQWNKHWRQEVYSKEKVAVKWFCKGVVGSNEKAQELQIPPQNSLLRVPGLITVWLFTLIHRGAVLWLGTVCPWMGGTFHKACCFTSDLPVLGGNTSTYHYSRFINES